MRMLRPSQPRPGVRSDALDPPRDFIITRASPSASGGPNAGQLFRRSAFDVAVVGAGASAAAAAAASARSGMRTVWLDGGPSGMPAPSVFHRRPSHAPARLACADARLVALALEGLDAWRSLGERFSTGGGGRSRRRGSSGGDGRGALLSEGGSLDLASSSSSGMGGTDVLEACAEAAREAGVRGARLLAASEVEAALGGGGGAAAGGGAGGGGGGGGLPLLSSSLRSVSGLFLPVGGSLSFAAADEAAAADAASAGVERWGPGFALAGWRDAGGGSRFELRGERSLATTAAGEEAAPLAEVERLVLVPPERGFEEFLARFGISLPKKESGAAKLVDVPWASVGGGESFSNANAPSFSQLTPCVLCHGLADRAADPGAPRGGPFEPWLFVPSNSGGSFGGSVSVPAAFARGSLSASAVSEAALAAREAFLNSDDYDGEEEAEEEFLFSPYAKEDAEAAAAAARAVLRPLLGSPAPRFAFASRTLVTPDGAPLCGWAPLELVSEEGEEEEEARRGGGGGGSSSGSSGGAGSSSGGSGSSGAVRAGTTKKPRKKPSFGALGSQSGRVLVLSPAAGSAAAAAAAGPSHGLLSSPVLARAAADLLSGFSSSSSSSAIVGGPLSAEALSPTRKAAGLRCVELARDSWEGTK